MIGTFGAAVVKELEDAQHTIGDVHRVISTEPCVVCSGHQDEGEWVEVRRECAVHQAPDDLLSAITACPKY